MECRSTKSYETVQWCPFGWLPQEHSACCLTDWHEAQICAECKALETRNCALRGFSGVSGTGVAESKLLLVTIAQDNKLREELLGEGRATLFQKPADQEGG